MSKDTPTRTCGECALCCTTHKIAPVTRAGRKCRHVRHVSKGPRCALYGSDKRPGLCSAFECMWLTAPHNVMPDELRPDRAGGLLTPSDDGKELVLYVDPKRPDAWRESRLRLVAETAVTRVGLTVHVVDTQTGEHSALVPQKEAPPAQAEGAVVDAELVESAQSESDHNGEADSSE